MLNVSVGGIRMTSSGRGEAAAAKIIAGTRTAAAVPPPALEAAFPLTALLARGFVAPFVRGSALGFFDMATLLGTSTIGSACRTGAIDGRFSRNGALRKQARQCVMGTCM